uniref:Uncharacterized protein n=1 Tax=Rhizophora mucronata TaxID=61149 RepID=A0A2P2R3P1_RHIMU
MNLPGDNIGKSCTTDIQTKNEYKYCIQNNICCISNNYIKISQEA